MVERYARLIRNPTIVIVLNSLNKVTKEGEKVRGVVNIMQILE